MTSEHNDTKKQLYVSFSYGIDRNTNTTENLIATLTDAVNKGTREIYLMLSTPGGSIINGINLYNTLRSLPVTLNNT